MRQAEATARLHSLCVKAVQKLYLAVPDEKLRGGCLEWLTQLPEDAHQDAVAQWLRVNDRQVRRARTEHSAANAQSSSSTTECYYRPLYGTPDLDALADAMDLFYSDDVRNKNQ